MARPRSWKMPAGSHGIYHVILLVSARDEMAKTRAPVTVNSTLGVLRAVLKWGEERGRPVNPTYSRVSNLKVVRNRINEDWWSNREVNIALACARELDQEVRECARRNASLNPARSRRTGLDRKGLMNFATAELLVALGCLLGLRVEEIIMLRWQDIDFDAVDPSTGQPGPVAHVRDQEHWHPKDWEVRSVPVSDDLLEILRRYRRKDGYILVPSKRVPTRGGTKRVYRYDPTSLWKRLLKRVEAAGARRISMRNLRHTFASNHIMAGTTDVQVARWLGHADTKMVHQHYGHLRAYHPAINNWRLGR